MTLRVSQPESDLIFYCTITCYNWINLFETTLFYEEIFSWFDILKEKKCKIVGYVVMPNHFHLLAYIPPGQNINKLVANGKRFMAYEIVKRLSLKGDLQLLTLMEKAVSQHERSKRKKHQVFHSSFDAKPVYTEKFLIQKLDYIHHNPVSGKWNLVEEFTEYPYSSAGFYELGIEGNYPITHYNEFFG